MCTEVTPWVAPKDGEWTKDDVVQQHLEDLNEVRAGAALQLARIAASGELNCESALAVVADAIGRTTMIYDDYQIEVPLDEQPDIYLPPIADLYFERIQS